MAERRMFAKTIIDSDAFLDLPASTQLLYFQLGMRADDDGFINNPKMIMRMVRAADDDINMLIAKKFILPFENGVVVIKHWRLNNYIQSDRYNPTKYKELLAQLTLDENKAYTKNDECIHDVSIPYTQVRLGKVSLDKVSKDNGGRFTPPTLEEVKLYCDERQNKVDYEKWYNFYSAKGWMVGKNKMKDWKAAVRTWEEKKIEVKEREYLGDVI
jgi:hypothetical protein